VEALNRNFEWRRYLTASGAPAFPSANVAWPDFFKAVDSQIQSHSLENWKAYLTWHLLHSETAFLPSAFVQENFSFFGQTLTGQKEMRPRWKRCVSYADNQLGEALGRKFVERTFGAEGKQRTLQMVDARKGAGAGHPDAKLDDSRDPPEGPREAERHHQQDRVPRQVARLFEPGDCAQ
jgi:endothelin-converting enzyme/putative endopeptidase